MPLGIRKSSDRRDLDRVPLTMYLNEYVQDRLHRAVTTNVSPTGIYLHRTLTAGARDLKCGREDRFVHLEFALPGTGETIWARGQVRYDEVERQSRAADAMVHGTGIYLTDLARAHAKILREYVQDRKRDRLRQILDLIRRNRYH